MKESIRDIFGSVKRKMKGQKFKDMVREGWNKASIGKYFGTLNKKDAERISRSIKEFRKRANKDYEGRKHALSR